MNVLGRAPLQSGSSCTLQLHNRYKHNPQRTGMSDEDAKAFFQLFNNAKDYLEKHFERIGRLKECELSKHPLNDLNYLA